MVSLLLFTILSVQPPRESPSNTLPSRVPSTASDQVSEPTTPGAPDKSPKSTACCLCVSKWNGDNELEPYAKETCENFKQADTCKKVEVEGPSCSLVKISYDSNHAIKCTPTPAYQVDKHTEIAPPSVTPCNAKEISGPEIKDINGDKVYCTCGRNPYDSKSCIGKRFVNGKLDEEHVRALLPYQKDCSRATCVELFPEGSSDNRCPAYIQEPP
jgi:hypothetical protein